MPFVTDETVRHGTTVEKLAKLPTVFDPEGSVTPGNASSINDAASALVLADGDYAQKRGLKPIGRLVGYAYAGVDPKYMGIGPVSAVQKLLKKNGFGIDDIDVFEVNEAFAAQALAVCSRATHRAVFFTDCKEAFKEAVLRPGERVAVWNYEKGAGPDSQKIAAQAQQTMKPNQEREIDNERHY